MRRSFQRYSIVFLVLLVVVMAAAIPWALLLATVRTINSRFARSVVTGARTLEAPSWRLMRGHRVIATAASVSELRRLYNVTQSGLYLVGPSGERYAACAIHGVEPLARACYHERRAS